MAKDIQLKKEFRKIQVVRAPKYRLATFGSSHVRYQLVTDVAGLPDRSRLRIGTVIAKKPSIITPQTLREQFSGFSEEAQAFSDAMIHHYGEALRGLHYNFENESISNQVELMAPDKLVQQLSAHFDKEGEARSALISGSERHWELSVMKFIVEETLASFSGNIQELAERGFFDGTNREGERRRREVENLFKQARLDPKLISVLGKKLNEYGLFDAYQDAFFELIR